MPLPAYRVKQSTDTTGTGTLVLNAASATARSFQQAYGTGARRVLYVISWATGYEIGLGDFDGGSPGSLTRATVLASSNSNALVSLPAGTKDVFIALLPGQREPRTFSASITAGLADLGGVAVFTGSSAATLGLPAVASVPPGASLVVCNSGTANLTIDPNGAETVSGVTTLVLPPGEGCELLRVGGGWEAVGAAPGWRQLRAVTVSAAAAVDLTLPAGFSRFLLEWENLVLAASAQLVLRTSTDGGSTFAAGGADYSYALSFNSGTSGSYSEAGASSFIPLSAVGLAGTKCMGAIEISPGAAGDFARAVRGSSILVNSTNTAYVSGWYSGVRAANGLVNAIRLVATAGNLTSGTVVLHGRRA